MDVLHSFWFFFSIACRCVFIWNYSVLIWSYFNNRGQTSITRSSDTWRAEWRVSAAPRCFSARWFHTTWRRARTEKSWVFFSKKDLNEWINKWITVLQGENSSPLWMWSCRLPLHSPWLPWLPCVTALAGQQPKRLRYNLKFPPVPSSRRQETASVRRLSCGQEDKNASHHYIPPVIRPPGWKWG